MNEPEYRIPEIDLLGALCSAEQVHASELQQALKSLSEAIWQTETVLEAMRAEHDPLAVHIFVSRRQYRNMPDTKSGSRRAVAARLNTRSGGFRGGRFSALPD